MSRIGKQPINIPKNVEIQLNHNNLAIKGPKGKLTLLIPPCIQINKKNDKLTVLLKQTQHKTNQAMWGTIQRLITNNIHGVTEGFNKTLTITGVGYRANIKDKILILEVGFSHPIKYPIPNDIDIKMQANNVLVISGIDKQKVGQVAAEIRAIKKPEPYKGKGIAYQDEQIRRKPGKQTTGASSAASAG